MEAARDEFRTSSRVDWVTDLCDIRLRNPGLTNIYAELGATFGQMVITSPLVCDHVLGMLVQAFGADHVLWGTIRPRSHAGARTAGDRLGVSARSTSLTGTLVVALKTEALICAPPQRSAGEGERRGASSRNDT
jgi:hypothetical protein